jgi:hypothetical protein
MGSVNSPTDDQSSSLSGGAGEQAGALTSSAPKATAIGADGATALDSDSELRLEGEEAKPDTLYRDGIDIEEEYDTPAGTRGSSGTIP